jgi:hypothetical protein
MTPTSLKRAAYGLIGLSLALVFLSVQWTSSSTPAAMHAAAPIATPTPDASKKPTLGRYNCGDREDPDNIAFNWTARKPNGGWVGEVTYAGFVKKPIQAFDAKFVDPANPKIIDWAFQAQDGSFLCRMTVDSSRPLNANVSFGTCRNNNWPQLNCSLRGD